VRVERKRGPVWYAHYREPSGRQHQKLIGRVWAGAGRPSEGYYTKKMAEDWLRQRLHDDAERVGASLAAETGATFADAAAEYLPYVTEDKECSRRSAATARSMERAACWHRACGVGAGLGRGRCPRVPG
jgi:hypothetical protein